MAAERGEMTPWNSDREEINELILNDSQHRDMKWMSHAGAMYLVPGNTSVNLSPFAAQHLVAAFSAALVIFVLFPGAGLGFLFFSITFAISNLLHRVHFERDVALLKASRFQGIGSSALRLMSLEMNAARGNREVYQHLLSSYLSNAYIQVNPQLLNRGMRNVEMYSSPSQGKAVNSMGFLNGFKEGLLDGLATSPGTVGRGESSSMLYLRAGDTALPGGETARRDEFTAPRNSPLSTDEGLLSALVKEDERYSALERLYSSRDRLTGAQASMVEGCIKEARDSYAILLEAREEASLSKAPALASSEEAAFKEFSAIIFHATDTISSQVSRDRLERMMSANSYMRDKFKSPGDLSL